MVLERNSFSMLVFVKKKKGVVDTLQIFVSAQKRERRSTAFPIRLNAMEKRKRFQDMILNFHITTHSLNIRFLMTHAMPAHMLRMPV